MQLLRPLKINLLKQVYIWVDVIQQIFTVRARQDWLECVRKSAMEINPPNETKR